MNWLPRLTLLSVCVLCIGAGCEASSQTLAGYLFSAFQSADNLTISAAAVSPSGNTTTYTDVVFPSVQLPSQTCGDRNGRCDVSVFTIDGSTRVAVLVAVGNGTVVASFDRLNNGLIFIDQHFFFLPGITCSLTTFVQDDIFLYGLCYEFTSTDGVVLLDVYRTVLNFDQLELSTFDLHAPRSTNFYISRGFLSSCTGFTNVYWFGNAFLYYLRVDISDSSINSQNISLSDPAIEQCFDNGTHQVVIFEDNSLLAYCNNNITVEVDFCQRSEPVVTRTRFYCSGSRDTYLEVSDNLTVNSSMDYAIPFPLDSSVPYVGDCVEIRGLLFFVGSSTNGFTVLTNVLGNLTTILATDAQVNHQVIDNRFILYSNSTSSALLDLSCSEPSAPIYVSNVSFELLAFFPNSEFSFTDQPTQPPTTAAPVPRVTTNVPMVTTVKPPPTTNDGSTQEPTGITNRSEPPGTMTTHNDTITSTTSLPPTGNSTGLTTGAVVWIAVGSFILLMLLLVCVGVCLRLIVKRTKMRRKFSYPSNVEMSVCSIDSPIEESTYEDTFTRSEYGPLHHEEELLIRVLPSPHNRQSVIISDHQGSLAQSQLPTLLTNPPPSPDSLPPPNVPPPVFASRCPPYTSVDVSSTSPPDSDTITQSDLASRESQEDTEAVQPTDKLTPSEVPTIPSEEPQTHTNVNLTSTPSPPTEPAEHLMDAVAVQDREENKTTILKSDTLLPTKNWSEKVRNVKIERSVQEIRCNADPHHHASQSSLAVSEKSDEADNGPEINRSTVTGHANLIPSNNSHSDEHAATLQKRDRKVDEYKTPPPQTKERPEHTTTEELTTIDDSAEPFVFAPDPPSSELNSDDTIQCLSGEVECQPEMPKLDCVMEIDQPKEEKDEHDDNNHSDEDL